MKMTANAIDCTCGQGSGVSADVDTSYRQVVAVQHLESLDNIYLNIEQTMKKLG